MHSKFPVKFHHRVSPPFLINPNHHHQFFCKIVCCAKNSSPQEDKFKFKLQGQSSGDNKRKFNDNGKEMELNLEPQLVDKKLIDGEGGAYYIWSSSKSPLLSEAKLGTGKFVLKPRGMALPHYADSAKIGYVVHGICTVGLVSPNSPKETILIIKKGDVIPVPLGAISWWFNHGDSELVIVYLGETRKAHVPGQFTYFYIAGTTSILGAFSTEFIARAFNLTETDSQKLPKSQTGTLIIKLAEGITIPPTSLDTKEKYIIESDKELVGKDLITITESNFGGLGKVGLSARVVKLGAKGMFGPIYTTDSSVQMIYVIKGSGKVQIVANGKRVLDAEVKEGELVIVPKFYAFAQIAGEEGMECFSVVTSPEPEFELLAGKESVWNSFSPLVMQTTLGITPEFEELFKSKNENSTVVAPPKKN